MHALFVLCLVLTAPVPPMEQTYKDIQEKQTFNEQRIASLQMEMDVLLDFHNIVKTTKSKIQKEEKSTKNENIF